MLFTLHVHIAMSYSPTDKPTVPQLCEELSSITEWENFATFLPGIEAEHIGTIRNDHQGTANQRRAVFQKWLEIYPGATWSDVYDALMKVEKKSLASSLVKARNQSVSDTNSSPMSLPNTQIMPEQDFLLKKSSSAPTVRPCRLYIIIHTTLLYRLMQAIWQVLFEQIQVK